MTAVLLTRPAGAGVQTLDEYDAEGGYEALRKAVQHLTPTDVLGLVRDAELRGRGGAAFPTGRKWELAASSAQTPSYVAGEETAALEVIEGRKAWPRKKPPYPGQSGLFGKPTTVNNVETLAHVPAIVRHGPDWFRALGVPGSAGTMLFTLDERVARPGVYELPLGR